MLEKGVLLQVVVHVWRCCVHGRCPVQVIVQTKSHDSCCVGGNFVSVYTMS